MAKPLIGLPGRRRSGQQIGFPPALHLIDVDCYLADYARGILEAGGLPLHLPLDADIDDYLPHLDGVVLTGGADVGPERYGARADGNGDYEPDRDERELTLLAGARSHLLPVLGICRGLQVVNVAAGGTLHQHVPDHACYDVTPDRRVHRVTMAEGSELHRLFGPGAEVNSLHHQTVDAVGTDLVVTATAPDGTVEGIEHVDGAVLAVQWHPEMLTASDPVFRWIVERATARRTPNLRTPILRTRPTPP
ncbi:MAG: gamma-glutamyl-gamma-aminobutyrate hydrolase family protein [Acidimicrobiales bacterium]